MGEWDTTFIYNVLESPRVHDFGADITVLRIDQDLNVVLGYTEDGSVFFGCPQIGDAEGFVKGRARLDVSQTIELKDGSLIEPAIALRFLVNSDEELKSVSTIFSGLYDLNRNSSGTASATQAAQGFENYFSSLPRIGMSEEVEVGLFGEVLVIEASSKKEELIKSWHSTPNSTYDFSNNGMRLEVKTSTRPTRLVWLRNTQSAADIDPHLTYVSVYAPVDHSGTSLNELVSRLRISLDNSYKAILDEKLSYYDLENCEKRFDLETGLKTLRFVSSEDVPAPYLEDNRILEYRWKCSFHSLPDSGDRSAWI